MLFSGSSNTELTQAVADCLGVQMQKAIVDKFNDGEIQIRILENVRGCDVFVMQSICVSEESTVNDNLMELYLMIRAMKRSSAQSVTAIIPYYGYARQDRKMRGRVPISASDVAMLLEVAGADHVVAIDLHCGQIQGFFHHTPVDNLFASTIFVPYIARLGLYDPVIVSPDAGGVERAKTFIEGLQTLGISSKMAVIVKQRAEAGVVETMNLVGKVRGSDVVIVDDICDTAGTLVKAAGELKEHGARRVFACITHPLLSGPAVMRIEQSCLEELIVTDTIPFRGEVPSNIKQLSVAPLLASAITLIVNGESLSNLFRYNQ
ncbi:MAG: ribose-phosphate pyrophosphokinase [Verrucomicrobia bacterium]|nr:ribose-phosphate pyrophosphokinase [Verrucomicrobiota bacterium]MBU6446395.1 ribose-phosphate pyrophosphokinase [Verrucomicrobiota bacterium]MDE3047598.1 ribose-phosphate pyrophosphokinase [Verrucomicrobiota bacterium]